MYAECFLFFLLLSDSDDSSFVIMCSISAAGITTWATVVLSRILNLIFSGNISVISFHFAVILFETHFEFNANAIFILFHYRAMEGALLAIGLIIALR